MTFYIPEQLPVILSMLLLGAFFGVVYDLFGVKRCFMTQSFRWLFIEDFLLSFFFCLCFILVVFVVNYGMLRWYEFFFCLAGFLLYRLTLGEAVFALLKLAAGGMLRLLKWLVYPVKLFAKGILHLCQKGKESLLKALSDTGRRRYSEKRKKRLFSLAKGGFRNGAER